MNEKVQEYLAQQRDYEEQKKNYEKEQTLISLGLYEKVYSNYNGYTDEFPMSEYDPVTNGSRFYRYGAVPVTDEEYAEILKYRELHEKEIADKADKKNPVASIFTGFGCAIFVIGFFLGIFLGQGIHSYHSDFSFTVALIYWGISFISGMFMIGFAEIIKLLNDIKYK